MAQNLPMSKTLLLIDDSETIHRLVECHLGEEFPSLYWACDGTSGLEVAARLKPDLILLDLDLPDVNGFDVCRFLKVNPATAGIPVIFVSTSGSTDVKVCGLELLAEDYVTKPFHPDELRARVRAALRGRGAAASAASLEHLAQMESSREYWDFN